MGIEDENKVVKSDEPTIVEKLMNRLIEFYSPADSPTEADETKSTQELIDEMEQIQDCVMPWEINKLMELHGFKLHYTGSGYVWLLKMNQ